MLQTHKTFTWTLVCVATLFAGAALADEKRVLTDSELAGVTAGTAAENDPEQVLAFEMVRTTRSGKTVWVEGDLAIAEALQGINLGTLTLNDNAQANLQSLININAVNSAVNVLLNLNVTIDSSVGAVNQLNFNTLAPPVPPRP
jgi:hypothetical protein